MSRVARPGPVQSVACPPHDGSAIPRSQVRLDRVFSQSRLALRVRNGRRFVTIGNRLKAPLTDGAEYVFHGALSQQASSRGTLIATDRFRMLVSTKFWRRARCCRDELASVGQALRARPLGLPEGRPHPAADAVEQPNRGIAAPPVAACRLSSTRSTTGAAPRRPPIDRQ